MSVRTEIWISCLSNILIFLLIPKKNAIFTLPHVVLLCIKMQHVCLFYTAVKNQTPSLRLDVSLLKDNINIYKCFIFMYVKYLRIRNIYK